MLQLQVLNRSPEIAAHASKHGRSSIIIVGSTALALYKVMLDMPLTLHRISVNDLDICVPDALQNTIRANDWRPNRYRGVITFRQEIDLSKIEPKLQRPVQIDAGTTVGTWSYGEAHEDALIYPGDGEHPELTSGYAVLHPLKQHEWYQELSRVKDGPRIAFLQTHIIPRLGEFAQFAINVPSQPEASGIWVPPGAPPGQ